MSRIRGKDTKPEMLLRMRTSQRAASATGFMERDLPGKPDMVFPRHRAVVFVHGCFWHGHGCSLFRWPKTRATFWRTKINRNMERDRNALAALKADGWRALVVWECAMRGRQRKSSAGCLEPRGSLHVPEGREAVAEIAEYENSDTRT